jgi:hypothetical protein
MANVASRRRRNSANGTYPAKAFPELMDWLRAGRPLLPEAAAQMTLTGLDIMESWLAASRQMIDLGQESVRDQQDSMLASWRQHVVNALAHEVEEEASRPSRRAPLANAARTGEAQTGATRH